MHHERARPLMTTAQRRQNRQDAAKIAPATKSCVATDPGRRHARMASSTRGRPRRRPFGLRDIRSHKDSTRARLVIARHRRPNARRHCLRRRCDRRGAAGPIPGGRRWPRPRAQPRVRRRPGTDRRARRGQDLTRPWNTADLHATAAEVLAAVGDAAAASEQRRLALPLDPHRLHLAPPSSPGPPAISARPGVPLTLGP